MNYIEIDELQYDDAVNLVRAEERCTFSLLQRKLRIGFNRAVRICDLMVERGVVDRPPGALFEYPILPTK
jgi:S-DNA-T family DNA segregation ATPase FtsK/SpoIIIE